MHGKYVAMVSMQEYPKMYKIGKYVRIMHIMLRENLTDQ